MYGGGYARGYGGGYGGYGGSTGGYGGSAGGYYDSAASATGKMHSTGAARTGAYYAFGAASRQSSSVRPKTYKVKAAAARANWLPSSDVGGPAAPTPRVTVESTITERFKGQGLTVYRMSADGNCLFRSFGFQLPSYGQGRYKDLRAIAVQYMREHEDLFAPFCEAEVGTSFEEYLRQMSQNKCWGGEPELSALACHFEVTVVVYDAYTTTSLQVYNEGHLPVILMCKSNGHYNAVIDNEVLSPRSQVFTPGHRNLAAIQAGQLAFPDVSPNPSADEIAPSSGGLITELPPETPAVEEMFEQILDARDTTAVAAEEESLEERLALRMAEWRATEMALQAQLAAEGKGSPAPSPSAAAAAPTSPNPGKPGKPGKHGKRALSITIPTSPSM